MNWPRGEGPEGENLGRVPCEVDPGIVESTGVFVTHVGAGVEIPEPEPSCFVEPIDRHGEDPIRGDDLPLENLKAKPGEDGGLDSSDDRIPARFSKE